MSAVRRMVAAHPRFGGTLRVAVSLVVVAVVIWFVLVPEFQAAHDDFGRLARLPLGLVLGAALLEVASLLSNTIMTTAILDQPRIPYRRVLAVDLADLAANHTLPGGGATAAAVRYRLLRSERVASVRAVGATTIEVVLSNVGLCLVFAIGAVFVVGRLHSSVFLTTAVVAVVLLALVAGAGWMLVRHPEVSRHRAGQLARRIPFVGTKRSEGFVRELTDALHALGASPRRAVLACLGALGNWVFDAGALWLMLTAFGQVSDPAVVLTAYGIGAILAQLPLTPGGVGIVEGGTTAVLVSLGVGHAPALLGVLGWRVLEYLLPTPLGWAAFIYLRVSNARGRRSTARD